MISIFFFILLCRSYYSFESCKKQDQYCFCDSLCSSYGDCCPGHRDYEKISESPRISTCKPVSQLIHTRIIDKCPDKNHRLADYCSKRTLVPKNHLKSMIPVMTKEGEVYENLFCALCNKRKKFLFLNITVHCVENQPKSVEEINELIENKSSCSVMISFPERSLRQCIDSLIRKCPSQKDLNDFDAKVVYDCEKKIDNNTIAFTNGEKNYRNEECCKCWNNTCFPVNVVYQSVTGGFSYLLNFNEWERTNEFNKTNTTTAKNETVNSFSTDPYYYISIFFSLLSISSLMILIGIYLHNPVFHTFGGYLTICLSLCTLLMSISPLILSKKISSNVLLCKLLAILKHYTTLCTFLWMSIYALDLIQTFALRSISKNQKKSFKTFLLYCGIGFGFVTLFVGSAVVIEEKVHTNFTFRPNYGGEYCWFTSRSGGIVWYFLPVCIFLTWNFIACVIVFYKLAKTAKECRVVQKIDSNNTPGLCVRLTAVFGIGYVFQVVVVISKLDFLIIAGSMINCLQGCFIAACFLWTKRIRTTLNSTLSSIPLVKSKRTMTPVQTTKATFPSDELHELNPLTKP